MHVGPVGNVSGQPLADVSCLGRGGLGPSSIAPGKAQAAPGQQAKGDAFPKPLSCHGLGKPHRQVPGCPERLWFPFASEQESAGLLGH